MCSRDPFSGTNKESSIWRQNDHAKFVGAFHLSRRVWDEKDHVLFSSVFSKLRIRLMEGHFDVFTRSVFRNQQKSDP